jgi:hypothetical protein
MLALISFLLAVPLGQPIPKLSDPPPCVAVNIKGCLPGFMPLYDKRGRLIYVRDPDYVPPLAQDAPAPLKTVPLQSAPLEQRPASLSPGLPPPRQPQAFSDQRGHVAIVFMPGVAAFPSSDYDNAKAEGQIAIELRGNHGGARVRLVGEYTSFGKIGELSFKYDLFDGFFFRPFLAVGGGVASINPDPDIRATGSASVGLDLYLSRDFFLTGELKRRLFMAGTSGSAHGLDVSDQKQTSLLIGMGFYFF